MKFAVGFLALVLTFSLVGCEGPTSNPPSRGQSGPAAQDFNAVDGALAEYTAVTTTYEMPQGISYPPAPFIGEKSTSFQAGYGTLTGLEAWNCAWGHEYLRLVGSDPAGSTNALNQYAAFMKTDSYINYYDPVSVQPVFSKTIEDAYLGDPSGIESLVTTNCADK